MAQQTAVEWFNLMIITKGIRIDNELLKILEKAKEMEMEQILEAYRIGWDAGDGFGDCQEKVYYNETYKY